MFEIKVGSSWKTVEAWTAVVNPCTNALRWNHRALYKTRSRLELIINYVQLKMLLLCELVCGCALVQVSHCFRQKRRNTFCIYTSPPQYIVLCKAPQYIVPSSLFYALQCSRRSKLAPHPWVFCFRPSFLHFPVLSTAFSAHHWT